MNSEVAINAADYFLREVPSVKTSNTNAPIKKSIVKEELQFLRLTDNIQEEIIDILKEIHGPDFKFADASDYSDVKSNIHKKYWISQGNLVIKGSCDYSQQKDPSTEENERLKQFALLRLESYGFHQNHCIEALDFCNGNIEDALFVLYSKYFTTDNSFLEKCCQSDLTDAELLEIRQEEKSSLDSIYEKSFYEKITDVWIINLQLDYLVEIFHNKEKKDKVIVNSRNKKPKCRNFIAGNCKYGDKCRFSHEEEKKAPNPNAHLENFYFELEIRFPTNSKYPFEPPLIFLKTNAILPPLMNLHICKRLHEEAVTLACDGIPSVYTIIELIQNFEDIKEHMKKEIEFIDPKRRLFPIEKTSTTAPRPTHYKKGQTNRSNKKALSSSDLKRENRHIVQKCVSKQDDPQYHKMLAVRQNLPAWKLKNDILNTLEKDQIVLVSGETGCGKSTQVPQFLLDDWIANYSKTNKHIEIVCTQPRRISAIGVSERVAEERLEKIGGLIGYQIRLENKISSKTRLTFCTTGILLRRLEGDPTLPTVTHIIVDEVHERSEDSDFLLLILKELSQLRPDLKIILMSATMNANLFSNYFNGIPIISIPGRTFPVEQMFLENIIEATNYVLEDGSEYCRKVNIDTDELETMFSTTEVNYANWMPKDSIKDENLKLSQLMARYNGFSQRTCRNLFLMDPEKVNNELIETILMWIVSDKNDYPKTGTILVFLPGIAEITSLFEQLNDHPVFGSRKGRFILLPLHSSLGNEEQAAIFRKPKGNQRKIVLSTNLAETSITIDDCVFVIDSGKMKEKHFDSNRNMESLETVSVTRANVVQRKGRAGRVMSGFSFHLYTNHRYYYNMLPQPVPEIHRIPLEQLILNIKVLTNFNDRPVESVLGSFIEPPVNENIASSIKRLQNVGALDKNNNLTSLGHHLAALPVDVRIGKLMLFGAIFGCVDAALTMAACLSFKSPFLSPFGKREEADKKKKSFAVGYSDHITVLMAYRKWLALYKRSCYAARNYANENFLSYRTLVTIGDIKVQFLEFLVDIGFISVDITGRRKNSIDNVYELTGREFNKNEENFPVLSSVLCAALYPNIIKILTPSKSFTMTAAGAIPKENNARDLRFSTINETVFIHPSSVNYNITNFPSPYMVYQEKVKTSKVYFRDCTMIPIIPLVLFSGQDLTISVQNGCTFVSLVDDWVLFQVEEHKIAEMIKMIRTELSELLEEKIQDPLLNLMHHSKGEKVISLILKMINS